MFSITVEGVSAAAREVEKYADSLESRIQRFCERLGEIGLDFLQVGLSSYDIEEPYNMIDTDGTWISKNVYCISLTGEDATFFEFGTGVYNPAYQDQQLAAELGFIRGEYGHGFGKRQKWAYTDIMGNRIVTRGFSTDHNLYGSAREMRQSIARVIQEVFK